MRYLRALMPVLVAALAAGAFGLGNFCARRAFAAAAAVEAAQDGGWALTLVSAAHPLKEPLDVALAEVDGYLFDARAAGALRGLLDGARADGVELVLVSTYRSFETSAWNFEQKVRELRGAGMDEDAARREARRWIAPPGCSEHHTGLAADVVCRAYADDYGRELREDFERYAGFRWLAEHCAEYGFILRYPRGGEEATGIGFEPWHYRYVGTGPARAIMKSGGTLEEYLEGSGAP